MVRHNASEEAPERPGVVSESVCFNNTPGKMGWGGCFSRLGGKRVLSGLGPFQRLSEPGPTADKLKYALLSFSRFRDSTNRPISGQEQGRMRKWWLPNPGTH